MKKHILHLFFILLLSPALLAQNAAAVKSTVSDTEGQALSFVTAILYDAADSSIYKTGFSNEKGQVILSPLKAGNYFLQLSYTGLKKFQSPVFELAAGEQRTLDPIVLVVPDASLDEVVIQAEKPLIEVKPDMTIFNVEGQVTAIGSNAMELLRKAPGVIVDNNDNVLLAGKSGVRIYIDDKPSPLSVDDLASYLRTISSDQIEAIEVITNPGARYEAEGNAGIINIRMKKEKGLGTNGTLNLGYGIGIYAKYNGSLSVNRRSKKANVFASYGNSFGRSQSFMEFYRVQQNTIFDQTNIVERDYFNHNLKAGVDYFINKKQTIGFLVTGYISDNDGLSKTNTPIIAQATNETQQILQAQNISTNGTDNYNFNLNYQLRNSSDNTLNVDLDYGLFRIEGNSLQPNFYLAPDGNTVLIERTFTNNTPTNIDIATLKLDKEQALLGGKLGAGIKLSYVQTDNIFEFYDRVDDIDTLNLQRSNQFDYTENVNAAYTEYQRKAGKFTLKAGLRAEQTNSLGLLTSNQVNQNDSVRRNYISLFPSGGISYQISRMQSLNLNYSRRIDRPRYQDLNPFEYKLDELTYSRGNPFLQPQFTHSLSLSHTLFYRYTTSVSYSHTNDYFTRITDTTESIRSFITSENLATRKVFNINLSAPVSIKKWWSTYTNLGVNFNRNEADFGVGKEINVQRWSLSVYHQESFTLPKDFTLEFSGFYNSPGIWGANYLSTRFWGVDAGIQKKFWQGRATLKTSVSDIFQTMRWGGYQNFGGLEMTARGGWESRQFKVNLTFMLGDSQVKSARKRKTGLDDESGRAKGGGGIGGP